MVNPDDLVKLSGSQDKDISMGKGYMQKEPGKLTGVGGKWETAMYMFMEVGKKKDKIKSSC